MALVEVRGVVRRYHKGDETITPLDGVSLDIEAGQFVSLMGASGSGKSTLLNLLAGIDQPDRFQGRSFRPLLEGSTPEDWPEIMYYRYWMHLAHHHVYAHYGVRTHRYKLIYYYADALGQPGAID